MPKAASAPAIAKTMRVADIVAICPGAREALGEYGIHCAGCSMNMLETLQEGCMLHGFSQEMTDELVDDLNTLFEQAPKRAATLTVTIAAAKAIAQVMEEEKRKDEGLAVIVDESGGFCMEFRPEPETDETTFKNEDVPDVRIFASALTLSRIGGSTIDFREGRFKLDLPAGDKDAAACGCGGSCSCK